MTHMGVMLRHFFLFLFIPVPLRRSPLRSGPTCRHRATRPRPAATVVNGAIAGVTPRAAAAVTWPSFTTVLGSCWIGPAGPFS
eukprot:SAG31_NODE_42284_length_272_cov_0.843931_1_plen_82_part_01